MTENQQQKQCTKCGQFFPATLAFFKPYKKVKCGLTSRCRECIRTYIRNYYKTDKGNLVRKKQRLKYSQGHKVKLQENFRIYYSTIKGYLACIYNAMRDRCYNSSRHNFNVIISSLLQQIFTNGFSSILSFNRSWDNFH